MYSINKFWLFPIHDMRQSGVIYVRLVRELLIITLHAGSEPDLFTYLPPPHDLEHSVKSVHSVHVGHSSSLHGRISHVSPSHPNVFVPLLRGGE